MRLVGYLKRKLNSYVSFPVFKSTESGHKYFDTGSVFGGGDFGFCNSVYSFRFFLKCTVEIIRKLAVAVCGTYRRHTAVTWSFKSP